MQAVHCGQVHCIKILEIECPKNDFLCLNACLSLFADNGDVSILVFFEDSYIFHLYGNLNVTDERVSKSIPDAYGN